MAACWLGACGRLLMMVTERRDRRTHKQLFGRLAAAGGHRPGDAQPAGTVDARLRQGAGGQRKNGLKTQLNYRPLACKLSLWSKTTTLYYIMGLYLGLSRFTSDLSLITCRISTFSCNHIAPTVGVLRVLAGQWQPQKTNCCYLC